MIRRCTVPQIWCVTNGRTDGWMEKVTHRGHLYMSLFPSIHLSVCLSGTISQELYIIWSYFFLQVFRWDTVLHLKTCQTSEMELFAEIVNSLQLLTILAKRFTLDVWQGPLPPGNNNCQTRWVNRNQANKKKS